MAEPWVSLLIGGTILLVGFAAYLSFQRYRIPDFFVLMILGAVLGMIPVAPFGPGLLASLGPLLVWADRTPPPRPTREAPPARRPTLPLESRGDLSQPKG